MPNHECGIHLRWVCVFYPAESFVSFSPKGRKERSVSHLCTCASRLLVLSPLTCGYQLDAGERGPAQTYVLPSRAIFSKRYTLGVCLNSGKRSWL